MEKWVLTVTCVACGLVSVGLETLGFRMLAPYFGSSVYVSGNLIGVVLCALTVGYYVGGRLADRTRDPLMVYKIIGAATVWLLLVYLLSRPLFHLLAPMGLISGSLLSAGLAFGVPAVPLSMVSPFIIRILAKEGSIGKTAGSIYALSTLGSLSGVFVTTFILIPHLGTRATIACFFGVLLGCVVLGLLRKSGRYALLSIGLLIFAVPEVGQADPGLLYETESLYGHVEVRSDNPPVLSLKINEGDGQSYLTPGMRVELGYRGILGILPGALARPPKDMLLLGLGGGTLATTWHRLFSAHVEIVEIDQAIVEAARRYFQFVPEQFTLHVEDARRFFRSTSEKYDFIAVDLYQGNSAPFHASTVEFFDELRAHLRDQGLVVLNVAFPYNGAARGISRTLRAVFPHVYVIPGFPMSLVIVATPSPLHPVELRERLSAMEARQQPEDRDPIHTMVEYVTTHLEEYRAKDTDLLFTDDRSSFEQVHFNAVARSVRALDDPKARDRLAIEAAADWPQSAITLTASGLSSLHRGARDEARGQLKKALEIEPGNLTALVALGEQLLSDGSELAEAERLLRRATEQLQNSPYLLGDLGWLALRRGEVAQAVEMLERATDATVPRSLDLEHLGDAYLRQGRGEEAQRSFEAALASAQAETVDFSGFGRSDAEALRRKAALGVSAPPAR